MDEFSDNSTTSRADNQNDNSSKDSSPNDPLLEWSNHIRRVYGKEFSEEEAEQFREKAAKATARAQKIRDAWGAS